MKPKGITTFGSRVRARTALAKLMKEARHADRKRKAGVTDKDLDRILSSGMAAADADRDQHEQAAEQINERKTGRSLRERVEQKSGALRDRCLGVVVDLAEDPATAAQAAWLDALSFEHFRVRTQMLPPSDDTAPDSAADDKPAAASESQPANAPAAPAAAPANAPTAAAAADASATTPETVRTLVARTDQLSIAEANLQFAQALLKPERAPIVAALAERDFSRDELVELVDLAQQLVDKLGGRVQPHDTTAAQREAEAIQMQKDRWNACRRMIRTAVRGDPELETLYSQC